MTKPYLFRKLNTYGIYFLSVWTCLGVASALAPLV